jgi:hypothetical protein
VEWQEDREKEGGGVCEHSHLPVSKASSELRLEPFPHPSAARLVESLFARPTRALQRSEESMTEFCAVFEPKIWLDCVSGAR